MSARLEFDPLPEVTDDEIQSWYIQFLADQIKRQSNVGGHSSPRENEKSD
jgi:hypothetical protein